jgi:hypothetical protein
MRVLLEKGTQLYSLCRKIAILFLRDVYLCMYQGEKCLRDSKYNHCILGDKCSRNSKHHLN